MRSRRATSTLGATDPLCYEPVPSILTFALSPMKLSTRLTWHAARTPLVRPLKAIKRAFAGEIVGRRRRFAETLEVLPSIDARARQLNEDGYVSITDLIDPEVLNQLQAAGDEKIARAAEAEKHQTLRHKSFWVRLLDEDMVDGVLPTDNVFVAIALQDPVLQLLTRALGEVPQMDYVLLTLSQGSDAPLTSSQLWHKDYDDIRTLKLFVYLTDVEKPEHGPFTFLPAPSSDKIGFTRHSHRPDEQVFRGAVRREDVREMYGSRMSAFIVETSRCLHMGSRLAPGHTRLLYTATFTTAPRLYPAPPAGFSLSGVESELALQVLEGRLT